MAGRKRERSPDLEEFRNVTAVMHASPNAKVHGVVTRLSQLKKGKYFNGELSDGKTKMRVFGFEVAVQRRLAGFHEQGAAVSLERCAVKPARDGKTFELVVKSQTVVDQSGTAFAVKASGSGGKVMTLDQIDGLEDNDRVTAVVKWCVWVHRWRRGGE